MAHHFESGMFVRTPAWHQLGNVLQDWPGTFEEARVQAGLTWDVDSKPVFDEDKQLIPGFQRIVRNDNGNTLTIQKDSYAVINNTQIGNVIDFVMNGDAETKKIQNLKFETLISLREGRQIIATMYLDEPMELPGDPSPTYPYMVFITRHDGQGGMRLGPTAVRVVCANTQYIAEKEMDRNGLGFTIKHTSNWEQRLEQARKALVSTFASFGRWEDLAREFARASVSNSDVEDFLDRWIPYSTDQEQRERENVTKKRSQFRSLLNSETCNGIAGTKWGLLQAAIELSDHFTKSHTIESEINRILGNPQASKPQAVRILQKL
jgi:phage/plasmid-like protein (TIGR03299 family)